MNLIQIVETLPPQVYIRRGELVIHFTHPADLISRVLETSAALTQLDRGPVEPSRPDGKAERGRRSTSRSIMSGSSQTLTAGESDEGSDRLDEAQS